MRFTKLSVLTIALGLLAACAAESKAPPVSTSPTRLLGPDAAIAEQPSNRSSDGRPADPGSG